MSISKEKLEGTVFLSYFFYSYRIKKLNNINIFKSNKTKKFIFLLLFSIKLK